MTQAPELVLANGTVHTPSGPVVADVAVRDGKIMEPVKGANLIGSGPPAMKRVTMVGNDMQLDLGVGMCGKNGQGVPVGVGQPTLRMNEVTVGGTGS